MLNIGGDPNDLSYRYKMPKLQARIEGRGNGIRTLIPNMVEVAKALNCPPEFPTKFFGIELGAQSNYDAKTERARVNGAFNARDFQTTMTKFISMYILCPKCGLPEISWKIGKSAVKISCAACGNAGFLPPQHRLTTYICKQKAALKAAMKAKDKGGRKVKGKDRRGRKNKDGVGGPSNAEAQGAVADEEVVWQTDTTKEAVQKRKEAELLTRQKDTKVSKVSAKDSPVLVLRDYMSTKKPSVDLLLAELARLQLARGFSDAEKMKILVESSIDTSVPKNVASQFKAQAAVFRRAAASGQGGQSASQLLLLCVEELAGVMEKKLIKRTPIILQTLYDSDVVSEEDILKWHSSPPETSLVTRETAIKVRAAAKDFVDWLQEAEESEGGSGSDE